MAHTLSAREAFELHKSAVTRDFIAKPRLGIPLFQLWVLRYSNQIT
jgi:hypothetical protein